MSSTDTRTDADRYAEVIADELVELAAGRLDDYEPEDRVDAAITWANELALDVEVTRNAHGEATAVDVARTIGGPTCWARFDYRDGITVRASWGQDRAEVELTTTDALDLAALMVDLLGEVAA